MANEPIYNVASADSKIKLCSAQTVVETRILPFAGVSISKVLSYSADGAVETTDVFVGEARVGGKITFRLLFLDAEGNCRVAEVISEFSDKITCDQISGVKPVLLSRILDVDITSLSADEIKLAAIVEMDLYDNLPTRIKYLESCPDDVYATITPLEYSKLIAKAGENFSFSGELPVEAERILLSESRIKSATFTPAHDSILVEGEVASFFVTEKGGEISSYKMITPFSNEIEASGSRTDAQIDGSIKVIKAVPVLLLDEQAAAIGVEYELDATAHIYANEQISPVTDAFSVINGIELGYEELEILKAKSSKYIFERVEGSVSLASDMPIADKILTSTGAKLNIANCYCNNDRLILEGTVNASIIYFSAETKAKNSLSIELPFSLSTNETIDGQVISAYGEISDLSAKIRRGSEIDVRAELSVCIHWAQKQTHKVVCDLNIGEKIELPLSAVSLHIGRQKETLWDIAKALRATPELIMLQNPELSLPLNGGERIIVYRHLKKL